MALNTNHLEISNEKIGMFYGPGGLISVTAIS